MNEFMDKALTQAKIAFKKGEIPIGAVIVKNGKIISSAHNMREKKQNAIWHAEMLAISKACKKLKSWRLDECEIYVTLEPCPMCAGAIINSRIKKVVYGAKEPKSGCCGSKFNLFEENMLNHLTEVEAGVMEKDCSKIIKDFFKDKRKK